MKCVVKGQQFFFFVTFITWRMSATLSIIDLHGILRYDASQLHADIYTFETLQVFFSEAAL